MGNYGGVTVLMHPSEAGHRALIFGISSIPPFDNESEVKRLICNTSYVPQVSRYIKYIVIIVLVANLLLSHGVSCVCCACVEV